MSENPLSPEFRNITVNEFPLWKAMRCAVYGSLDDEFNEKEMHNIIYHKDWFCMFIVDNENEPIGMLELSSRNIVDDCLSSPVAYIEGLFLEKEYRGRGIGKQVIRSLMEWCKKQGFSELATDTTLDNLQAQSFYETLGFEESEKIVQYRIPLD